MLRNFMMTIVLVLCSSGCGSKGILRADLAYDSDELAAEERQIDAALSKNPRDLDWSLRRAALYYSSGRHPAAERVLVDLLQRNPAEPQVHVLHGFVLRDLGREGPAAEAIIRARNLDPSLEVDGLIQSLLRKGLTGHLAKSEWKEASELAEIAANFGIPGPQEPLLDEVKNAFYQWGKAQREGGYYRGAIASLKGCFQPSGRGDCAFELGAAYSALGDMESAKGPFAAYVENSEDDEAARLELGVFLEESFLFEAAEKLYKEGLALHPASDSLIDAMLMNLLKQRETKRAVEVAQTRLANEKTSGPEDWVREGMRFQRFQEEEIAAEFLEGGMEKHPGSLALADAMARSFLFRGQSGAVRGLFDKFYENNPNRGAEIGSRIEALGLVEDARDFYEELGKSGLEHSHLLLDAARMAYEMGDWKACNRFLEQYGKKASDRGEAAEQIGIFYGDRKNIGAAERYLKMALKSDPSRGVSVFRLAGIYRANKRGKQESRILKRYLKAEGRSWKSLQAVAVEWEKGENWERAEALFREALRKKGLREEEKITSLKALTNHLVKRGRLDSLLTLLDEDWSEGTESFSAIDAAWEALRKAKITPLERILPFSERRLKAHPNSSEVQLEHASVLVEVGKRKEAIPFFKSAIELSASPSRLFDVIAQELTGDGGEDLLVLLADGLDEIEMKSEIHLQLGILLLEEGPVFDRKKGLGHMRAFLEDSSLSTEECLKAGESMLQGGFLEMAEYAFARKSCRVENHLAELGLGRVRLRQGKLAEALELFRSYVAQSPDPGAANELVAGQLLVGSYPASSIEFFEKALKTMGSEGWSRLVIPYTTALGVLGDAEGIRSFGSRYLKKEENSVEAKERVVLAYGKQGLVKEATRELQDLVERRRGNAEIEEALGRHAFGSGMREVGLDAFRRAARLWGGAPRHISRMGEVLEGQGEYEVAIELYDEASLIHKNHPLLAVRKGVVELLLGREENARDAFFEAVSAAESSEAVINYLAPRLRSSARLDLMEEIVDLALARSPQNLPLLLRGLDTQLLQGDLDEGIRRSKAILAVHRDAGVDVGEIFESHQLDRKAFDVFLLALSEGRVKEDPKGRLIAGLLRTGSWSKSGDMAGILSRYDKGFSQTASSLGVLSNGAASFGDFEGALGFAERRFELEGDVKGAVRTGLLATQVGDLEKAKGLFMQAARLSNTAEDGELLIEAAESLSLRGEGELATQLYEEALGKGETLVPWIGADAIGHWLWGGNEKKALAQLSELLQGDGFFPFEELTRMESWFVWAGKSAQYYEVLERSLETSFRARIAILLARANAQESAGKWERLLAQNTSKWDSDGQVLLAGSLLDAGLFKRANSIADELLSQPGNLRWEDALYLRLKSDLLAEKETSWEEALSFSAEKNQNQRQAFDALRKAARRLQLWSLEKKALEMLVELSPTRALFWLNMMEVSLFEGNVPEFEKSMGELLMRSPNQSEVLRELVGALEGQFEYRLALNVVKALLAREPGDRSLRWKAGRLCLELGQEKESAVYFNDYQDGHWSPEFARSDIHKAFADVGLIPEDESRASRGNEELGWLGRDGALLDSRLHILEGKAGEGLALFGEKAAALDSLTSLLDEAVKLRKENPDIPSKYFIQAVGQAYGGGAAKTIGNKAFFAAEKFRSGDVKEAEKLAKEVLATGTRSFSLLGIMAEGALDADETVLAQEILDQMTDVAVGRKQAIASAVELVSDRIQESRGGEKPLSSSLGPLSDVYLGALQTLHPSHIWYATLGSDIAEVLGDKRKAEAVFEKAMMAFPLDSSAYNNLAYLLARRGENLAWADVLVKKAMRLEPKHNVYYLDTAGWIAFQQGELERARDYLLASLRQMTGNQGASVSESLWHLGRVYEEMGEIRDARWCYRKAERLAPSGLFGVRAAEELERLRGTGSKDSLEQL